MEKTMKSSASQTIVVQMTADNVQEFDIDTGVFDDPFMEAATRAVEKTKTQKQLLPKSRKKCMLPLCQKDFNLKVRNRGTTWNTISMDL